VIIVGNGMVGKTTLLTRFAKGRLTEDYKKTIGTDFMEKEITVPSSEDGADPHIVKLMLWDTAGQEMFAGLTRNYYRGSGAVVYVFSTTDEASFRAIPTWKEKVESECGPDIVSILVQNKVDLIDEAKMTSADVEALATRLGMKLYRTSVTRGLHVDEVFADVANQFIETKAQPSTDEHTLGGGRRRASTDRKEGFGSRGGATVSITKPATRRTGGKKGCFF
jgi:Ras-related protein Rab-23